ncbi:MULTISPECIES: diaminopimelate epimerase [Cupriavidus]|uniref:Diaminopimelate epimerase n=1 Tax=Cupriavidus pinatubonensis (strain JMP 134 / LMG 1197) TaxID=264198 RepID=DAPF_CUPPJ|nr:MULTISPECIES: diaminopimelate epimerase [Cupriavidus]Q476V3.1 RecName: Full=Diaminopimelate epimerase; Short=DAP epimerase; AltName: Full=PLP-independent amino acid racemase [Cupriavidus pinatubonensis JMP134]QYY31820.1 diaminopimelate epimerase [Cupriavidus pinatubonensis]TPQ42110.1 diaminopimelate epimerase [Cupriavidus pinatubonensis]
MKLQFTKMHGAGNDFVVLDGIHQKLDLTTEQWRALASRHFGVGADQMLIVEKPTREDVDFRYRIFNADGSEVEHCGNGARCFVRFVTDKGMTDKRSVRVEVMNGVITLTLQDDGQVTVDMGAPELEPARVPFRPDGLPVRTQGEDIAYGLEINGRTAWISPVSMGNPHAVQVVDDVENFPVLQDGPLIEHHATFPNRVNAGFLQVVDRHTARLRVFERGAGETLACGTGACAAVVAGIRRGLLDSPVKVHTHGGDLNIAWDGGAEPVRMTGPATTVFEGTIDLAALPA